MKVIQKWKCDSCDVVFESEGYPKEFTQVEITASKYDIDDGCFSKVVIGSQDVCGECDIHAQFKLGKKA